MGLPRGVEGTCPKGRALPAHNALGVEVRRVAGVRRWFERFTLVPKGPFKAKSLYPEVKPSRSSALIPATVVAVRPSPLPGV